MKKPSPIPALAYNFLILICVLNLILAPRPLTGWMNLSSAVRFDKAGEHSAAALAYKSAAERLPWQPSLWEKAGTSARLGGNLPDAITLLTKAAARNAISKNGWVSLGLADQESGDLPAAMKAWRNALPMAAAYRYLAQGQRISGDFPAALDSWQASLLQEPQEASAHYQVGLLEMALAPSKALPNLMRAVQLDPKLDATVQNLRGALNAGFAFGRPLLPVRNLWKGAGGIRKLGPGYRSFS